MSANKLKVQAFRTNDLSEDTGKQFELGKSWCDFFEIADNVGDISFKLEFKPINNAYESLNGRQIDLQLSGLTNRNDRKAYANGTRSGHSAIKEFFLEDLHLSMENNSGDYFAIYKANAFDYYLYYIPKLLHDNFIRFFETISPTITISRPSEKKSIVGMCLLQIFYGAPGTGKSKTIKEQTEEAETDGRVFRTTFHPDSDYSTFVGCYKPTKVKTGERSAQPILDYDSLVDKFKEYLTVPNVNITKACTLFGFDYHDSIIRIQENGHKVMDLVNDAYKSNTSYDSVVRGGMACYEQNPNHGNGSKITYEFVPQAFTNAYVKAWNTEEDVYLIIEEINRGNCAQIFGDLFQLLDRKNGVSEYPIDADADLANYLSKKLAGSTHKDITDEIREGKKLKLPSNLYIWATMNTSDQSLFPIDSAFKRRWDWKYMKIRNHPEENYKIKLADKEYDWWEFIQRINKIIASMTSSADKQLGYFFCKATDGNNISPETFVSKVIFYLWNDVFKDYGFEDESLFSYKEIVEGKEERKELTFPDFYNEDGEKVDEVRLKGFLDSVMNWKKDDNNNNG